jgi:ketosteroid isomerase-like protein
MKLFTAHLGLWLTRDPDSYPYEKLITEDAVFEYPYAQAESARHIEGRAAIAETLRKLPRVASDWQVDDVKLFQTPHSEIFFVAYQLSAAQHAYAQRYLARITVRDGQIANYFELWDRSVAGAASATASHN